MSAPRVTTPLAIEISGVVKTFGGVVANRDASLEVPRGEIHALVGENGAGKSTLMRVLSGMYAPDDGRVQVNGRDVTGWKTTEAIAAGVGMVHQHFMLVPTLTVAENVVLGIEPVNGWRVDLHRAVIEVESLCHKCGLHVDPRALVADLSVGEAQRVEILKALYRGAKVLILDEPTAVLSPPEVQELWSVLRALRDDGGTVVLITHKLDEVIAVSDAITVMRAGATVSRFATAGTTPRDIARAMVGRDVNLHLDAMGAVLEGGDAEAAPVSRGPVLLSVKDLHVTSDRGTQAVSGLSFDVHAGEILGVAGVEGNGQTELLEAIAGLRGWRSGSITLGSTAFEGMSVRQRADSGLSHIPEDRHRRGLVLDYSIADNLILGQQHRFSSRAGLDQARIARHALDQVSRFDIRPPLPDLAARALSGGNQQKIVIAREMGRDFRVLLAAQPTRGVDVGAIEFIHEQLRAARSAGKAILLVSADLPEVLALADRVAVMYGGKFVAVLPASQCTPELLGPYMTGAAA
ncbi:MAG: ABC transporter ATP-binding protein [Gemmatimonadaceae bacterium]|nr:ABC transporter ATP-binding protein [Gemmatimonadaceae bacterium]